MLPIGLALALPANAGDAKVVAMRQRREGSLKVGDKAPDPSVVAVDGGARTLLAGRKTARPLVLIFGSFT